MNKSILLLLLLAMTMGKQDVKYSLMYLSKTVDVFGF